ncbi:Fpg/Nei family DNA glycosylase [Nesterenkonia muleiensis]|uniref:Fpg/Nei family DNA glycosylase n=1 Tax=Nesterenkonia muleiensis TaxID=2282648 RepID=UPI000E73E8F2|nr:DNA-formamidopyrimidine glycosylase family protein [Nesterenkonia muleiensis]
MPEGHTLHRLASQVQRLFVGRSWRVSSPQGRFDAGAARLHGRVPERAEAWGKQLFVHLGADIWQVHLGLYGAFSFRGDESFAGAASLGAPRTVGTQHTPEYDDTGWILPEPPRATARARIHVPHGWADLRGPSRCAVLNPMQYEAVIARLGPDPLRQPEGSLDEALLGQFQDNLRRRRISIAAALMDQAVIAGVGNIYRAESLFTEGLSPDTPSQELSGSQVSSLWATITGQLRDGVSEGTIRTLRADDPHLGLRGADVRSAVRRHWVYKHQGTPCLKCGETIRMRELQGRRLYWCPGCQTH